MPYNLAAIGYTIPDQYLAATLHDYAEIAAVISYDKMSVRWAILEYLLRLTALGLSRKERGDFYEKNCMETISHFFAGTARMRWHSLVFFRWG